MLVVLDFLALSTVLWAVISLRYNSVYWPSDWPTTAVFFAGPLITITTFAYAGLYRLVTRYLGTRGHTRIVGCVVLSVLIWSQVVFMSGQLGIPRSVIIIYGAIAALVPQATANGVS